MKIMPSFHFYRWLLLILRILWKYGIISMPTKKLRGVSPEGGTDFPYIISIYISNIQNYHNFRLNNVNDFIFAPRLSIDKKNIFWDFCGNPTWWRHFTSHDVILLYLAKMSPINCWRLQIIPSQGQPESFFLKGPYKGVHMKGEPFPHDNWFTFYRCWCGGPVEAPRSSLSASPYSFSLIRET